MTKHNDQLLPCPFCGGAMRIESNRDWHRLFGEHDESCCFPSSVTMMVPALHEQRVMLVDDWNRRAQLPTAGGAVRMPERKRTDHLAKDAKTMTPVRAAIEAYNRALDDVAALNTAPHPVSGEQKAIHQWEFGNAWMDTDEKGAADAKCEGFKTRIVYAAPPAAQDVSGRVEQLESAAVVTDEWIDHGPSKPCPFVSPYTSKADIRLRDGTEKLGDLACNVMWFWYEHNQHGYDVVAYRPAGHRNQAQGGEV